MPGGSPPQAWGQLIVTPHEPSRPRFTPTGVGTMRDRYADRLYRAVHPHRRGDNVCIPILEEAIHGSPPQAWGQSHARDEALPVVRFTPTGVGTILASQAF